MFVRVHACTHTLLYLFGHCCCFGTVYRCTLHLNTVVTKTFLHLSKFTICKLFHYFLAMCAHLLLVCAVRISSLYSKNSDLGAELVKITSKMEVLLYERDTPFMHSGEDLEVSERLKEAMEAGTLGKLEAETSTAQVEKP